MQKFVKPSRIIFMFTVMAIILTIYIATLYKLQIFNDGTETEVLANSVTKTETVTAARGDIVDRNGVLLVSSRAAYNVTLSRSDLREQADINDIILRLIYAAAENEVEYTDTFPVTSGAPFSYLSEMTSAQQNRFDAYLEYFDLDPDISASDLIVWMKSYYGISYTTPISDARLIIGIRYELKLREIVNIDDYVFAEDVGTDFVSILEEQGFPGVNIEKTSLREYHTDYAAHILGYLALMDKEEYEYYKELDYAMDTYVGQSGVEQEFEEYLHGTDGIQKVTISESGAEVSVETVDEAVPGQNIYLTIDIGLQAVAEESLEETIDKINTNREAGDLATCGAVVVLDVNSGETLALASYPTYDLSTFLENYSSLENDTDNPFFNRATQGTYNPGSTFKMVTALAGLRSGVITRWTTVNCTGKYTAYDSYQPNCWIRAITGGGHGPLDVVGALQHSCNFFFYWVGDHTGIDAITEAALDFGFGSTTGLEIYDVTGTVSSVEYKETTGERWYAADTLLTAIGQSDNMFTPVQLANYVATIANGGTRYSLTILNSVRSSDYSEVIYDSDPVVLSEFEGEDAEYIEILQDGMEAVTSSEGTAASVFADYSVKVAAKTGTVQSDTEESNNGIFVCYAPANDPEIAIALVVEKGTSGSTIMIIAKEIMDYYFSEDVEVSVVPDNTMVP